MPPSAVKTIKEVIYYQYAKIISSSSGFGKANYGMIMSKWKQLCSGEINWSSSVREWLREKDDPTKCIYCGEEKELTVEHILPRCCAGEDTSDNVVMVCKSCNSSKGGKRLYEWRGLDAKDTHHRIAEGKYLKYLYSLHEKQGTLDCTAIEMCSKCNMRLQCEKEDSIEELSVYCIEGCFCKG
jgi:HNH endonuclease